MWTEQTEISDSTERGVWWEPALLAIILHKKTSVPWNISLNTEWTMGDIMI